MSKDTCSEQEPAFAVGVVTNVLAEHTKKNKFLQNVGIQIVRPRSSIHNLEAQLMAEKRSNVELRSVINTQQEEISLLSEQLQQAEHARRRDKEEKKQAETDAKLELLLSRI